MNFLISIIGWVLWNLAELEIERASRANDSDPNTNLNIIDYAKSHWVLWIGSLLCIPVLLWLGYRNLNIDPFGNLVGIDIGIWNDLYILGSGAAFEGFIFGVKKIRSYLKKKEQEL